MDTMDTTMMDTTITTTEDLERRISGIIHTYRQEAYAVIEEKMWAALAEAATCILQNEGLFLLSRRAINGVSTSTLNNACKIIESEGKFSETDEHLKKCYMLESLLRRNRIG